MKSLRASPLDPLGNKAMKRKIVYAAAIPMISATFGMAIVTAVRNAQKPG
jgi:hypothetical protein